MKYHNVGIDLGKSSFHLCCVDKRGRVIERKRLTRKALKKFVATLEPCPVAMEACGGSRYVCLAD